MTREDIAKLIAAEKVLEAIGKSAAIVLED